MSVSAGSRPPLILQSPPPYTSPRDAAAAAEMLLDSPEHRKKLKKLVKDEVAGDPKNAPAMYDIVSPPSKDSTKLTLKLSRVKSGESEPPSGNAELLPGAEHGSDTEGDLPFNSLQPFRGGPQDPAQRLGPVHCLSGGEQSGYQQVPVLQNTGAVPGRMMTGGSGTPYDEAEMDALAEIERIERESAIERERCSKEVQDKGTQTDTEQVFVDRLPLHITVIMVAIFDCKLHS